MVILIDPQIRNWVFFPILAIVVLFAYIRTLVKELTKQNAPTRQKIVSKKDQEFNQIKQVALRVGIFSRNKDIISRESFDSRINAFLEQDGMLKYRGPDKLSQEELLRQNPMMQQGMISGMLKQNLVMMVVFPLQYFIIQHLFSGLIIGKIAFPLSQSFKQVLQKGINVSNLSVQYISGISLYFLSFVGVSKLIFILSHQKIENNLN